jgi:hypothetical protein
MAPLTEWGITNVVQRVQKCVLVTFRIVANVGDLDTVSWIHSVVTRDLPSPMSWHYPDWTYQAMKSNR